MHANTGGLAKRAIEAALKSNWTLAVEINTQILEIDPKNQDAKIRLGRAYIQIKEFSRAKKIFEDVLKDDPINQIAIKNLQIAKEKKVDNKTNIVDPKELVFEPGTTEDIEVNIDSKGCDSSLFKPGEIVEFKIKKNCIEFYKIGSKKTYYVGQYIKPDIVHKLYSYKLHGGLTQFTFIKGTGKKMWVMIKVNKTIFKGDKQDIKPYLKKGSIDEPEIETEELEKPEIE